MTDIFHKMPDTSFRFSIDRGEHSQMFTRKFQASLNSGLSNCFQKTPRIMLTHPARAFAASWNP
ncbi:MAG: hypothetical protein CM1200mP30_09040 [Pseudomonadota bacterium]|nr:MAG: hypothetical protein CM1200mP30_09040 [Pseudomonadota bacterium]